MTGVRWLSRRARPDNPLPGGHPFRFQPSLAAARGVLVLRHVGAATARGAVRSPQEAAGRGQWVAVESALCFAGDRPLAGGILGLGGLLWAEWPWVKQFDAEESHLQVRFRTGRERSAGEYREAELEADDVVCATRLAQVCRELLDRRA